MALDEGSFRLASSRERARLDVWRLGRTGPRKAACGDRGLELRVPEGPPGTTFKTPYSTTQAMVWGKGGRGKFNKTYPVAGDSGIRETAKQAINHYCNHSNFEGNTSTLPILHSY